MKFIQIGDKGEYKMTLEKSAEKDIVKDFNSIDLYFNMRLKKKFELTHNVDEVIKVNDYEIIIKVTCIKECYYHEVLGRFCTLEEMKQFDKIRIENI